MAVRADVTFRGRVQGVGFRATVRDAARGFTVGGWVRNEPDGSVRLLAEGAPDQVDAFVREIQRRMDPFITSMDRSDAPLPDDETSRRFEIAR